MSNGAYYESPPVGVGESSDTSWYDWETPLHDVYDPFIDWPSPLQQPDYPISRYSGIGGESYYPDYQVTDYRFPATQQQTIIPPPPTYQEPQWYDWQEPLSFWDTGDAPSLQAPSVSTQPLPVSPAGLPWIPDEMLDPRLQPPEPDYPLSPAGLPYIPDYMLDPRLQPPAAREPGILENIGDFFGNIGDFLWDTGESLLKNVRISSGQGGVTSPVGVASPVYQAQYPVAADRTTSQEYVRIESQGYATGTAAPSLRAGAGLGDFLDQVEPKFLLIGGGIILLYLATRK
jgi:hypothetical protein